MLSTQKLTLFAANNNGFSQIDKKEKACMFNNTNNLSEVLQYSMLNGVGMLLLSSWCLHNSGMSHVGSLGLPPQSWRASCPTTACCSPSKASPCSSSKSLVRLSSIATP